MQTDPQLPRLPAFPAHGLVGVEDQMQQYLLQLGLAPSISRKNSPTAQRIGSPGGCRR
jgi:hypothetical protein